jgi:hypothetical protein
MLKCFLLNPDPKLYIIFEVLPEAWKIEDFQSLQLYKFLTYADK